MFSVIIPVYNGEKFIKNAIESVFMQTVSDWELIIVNDGSSDNTLAVLEKYRDYEYKDWMVIKSKIREQVSHVLYQRTKRSPMVLPIVMEI